MSSLADKPYPFVLEPADEIGVKFTRHLAAKLFESFCGAFLEKRPKILLQVNFFIISAAKRSAAKSAESAYMVQPAALTCPPPPKTEATDATSTLQEERIDILNILSSEY